MTADDDEIDIWDQDLGDDGQVRRFHGLAATVDGIAGCRRPGGTYRPMIEVFDDGDSPWGKPWVYEHAFDVDIEHYVRTGRIAPSPECFDRYALEWYRVC